MNKHRISACLYVFKVFELVHCRKRSVVGRYESHQNEVNVYCEPQKGIVNLAAETGSGTDSNHYAHMSDI